MLHAILQHKIGRNLPSNVWWSEIFTGTEDSLTSSVFGELLHLSTSTFWGILRRATYGDTLPTVVGELLSYSFWPRWRLGEDESYGIVEPDVFLRFELLDLVIEAKRYDDRQQSSVQWEREAAAYQHEFAHEERPMILLAVGGLHETLPWRLEDGTVVAKTRWARILNVINSVRSEISTVDAYIKESAPVRRVLTDTVDALNLHGFWQVQWLADTQYSIRNYSVARLELMETY